MRPLLSSKVRAEAAYLPRPHFVNPFAAVLRTSPTVADSHRLPVAVGMPGRSTRRRA